MHNALQLARPAARGVAVWVLVAAIAGCSSAPPVPTTGFLSDYSQLKKVDARTMRTPDKSRLGEYSSFIVGPIEVRRAEGVSTDATDEDLRTLAEYFDAQIREEIGKGYTVVGAPGPGVARVRAAITGAQTSTPLLNVHPATRFSGAGAGSAIAECEIVDSQSGEQIAAYVESRQGPRVGLEGTSRLGDAQAVLRGWAAQLRRGIDEAHGKQAAAADEP